MSNRYVLLDADGAEVNTVRCEPSKIADLAASQGCTYAEADLPPSPPSKSDWAALRAERNRLLSATDWTQLADAPTPDASWATYRQALRDLPETTEDPRSPEWPTPPDKEVLQ